MRRYLIVAAVVVVVGPLGEAAFAQQRPGGATTNQGFQVGGATGSGQGEQGNFGVGTAGQVDTNARYMRDNRQGNFVGSDSSDTGFVGAATVGRHRSVEPQHPPRRRRCDKRESGERARTSTERGPHCSATRFHSPEGRQLCSAACTEGRGCEAS